MLYPHLKLMGPRVAQCDTGANVSTTPNLNHLINTFNLVQPTQLKS